MAGLSQAEYCALDATGMAALVRARSIHADELLEAALVRLALVEPHINAVVALYEDRARQQARLTPADGPLSGVPFLLKDLFTDLTGTLCTNGSDFHSAEPAICSSTVVDCYERSGLLIFGRTHSPEFGGTSTSESRRHGITRNPYDLQRSAGGSSGGAAAVVATGVVPVAQATDAGGSIIIPASCCGLFGLKPSRGLVPLGPARIEGAGGLAVQHVLSRSVRDSAVLLDIACTGPPIPGITPPIFTQDFPATTGTPGERTRIALVRRSVHGIAPAVECMVALDEAATLCLALGHEVEETVLPVEAAQYADQERALRLASIAFTIDTLAARLGRPPRDVDLEAATWLRYQAGTSIPGTQILEAREHMLATGIAMQLFMERYDFILTPSMADLPPLPGTVSLDRTDPEAEMLNRRLTTFCGFYNWTGQPAMSVPLHMTTAGLPVGVLFAGRYGEDARLLRLAAELEAAQPWTGFAPMMPPATMPTGLAR